MPADLGPLKFYRPRPEVGPKKSLPSTLVYPIGLNHRPDPTYLDFQFEPTIDPTRPDASILLGIDLIDYEKSENHGSESLGSILKSLFRDQ